jgi:hypothetical protein
MDSKASKEFKYKTSLLLYLSSFMDVQTINKMILLNKHFYEIFTNDIVWNNVFHKNFLKLRMIDKPGLKEKSLFEKNMLGKKRKKFISIMKTAKNTDFESFNPEREDRYSVIITGFLEYMPIENAIQEIYGKCQDIFSFFNCFFFFDDKISQLSFYSWYNIADPHLLQNTDCFLFAFNRHFPSSFSNLDRVRELWEKGISNIIFIENTYSSSDLEKYAERLHEDELEEFKQNLANPPQEQLDKLDEFLDDFKHISHIKVDTWSNEVINSVFYQIIMIGRQRKDRLKDDPRGPLIDEKNLLEKVKNHPVSDINMKTLDEINGTEESSNGEPKKCAIF